MSKKLIYLVSVLMVLGLISPVVAQDMEIGVAVQPPVIDGQVDDVWANASEQYFVPLEDPADGSGIWKVLYDAENLYVLVDMTDDSLQNDSASSWQDDSVEIYFDGGNTKVNTPLSGDDHQYTFGWTTDEIQGNNIDGATDGFEHAQVDTGTGWRIEVKMPWMSIWGVVPQAGDLVGIDCYYNDDDDGGDSREGKMLSFSVVEGWNDASQWASAILAEAEVEVEKTVLFAEDFEGLALGPNVDESLAGDAVWTDTPPEGWIVDESGIPGISMDATDGITEWAGWAFADKAWWIEAAGDQDRSLFELGSGIVAVADPDEWDDGERLPIPIAVDPYDTWLTTPAIKIAGVEAGTLELKFDSSWRPEFDDNLHQTANITASFDGGEPVVVMLWESDEASANYKPYATNETVIVKLDNPEGAKKVVLTFGLFDAGNDWWWAIDNVEVRGVVPDLGPVKPSTEGLVAYYALDGDATDSSGNGLNGTLVGDAAFAEGMVGMALDLDGDGDYVDCSNNALFSITDAFTLSVWINWRATGATWQTVVAKGDNAWRLARGGDTQTMDFGFTAGGTRGWQAARTASEVPLGEWHHVVATIDTTDGAKIYLDGVLEGENPDTGGITVGDYPAFIGENPQALNRFWNGLIDEVMIYSRVLSEAEIRYLAGERATPVDPGTDGLAAFYAFENDVLDGSGNSNDGTIVGAPTFVDGLAGYGMAMEFDGESYVDVGSDASLDITGPISMGIWIRPGADDPEGQGTEAAVMAKADSAGSPPWSWQVRYGWNSPQPYMAFTFNTSPRAWAYVGKNLELDEWAHIACSHDGATLKCYLNGEQTDSTPMGAITSSPTPVLIGSDGWRSDWIGALDEVAIYNRALSDGEIRYLAGIREFKYDGDALDDTWDHDNGSDAWDGTGPGEGNPGGAASLTEDGVTFLRIQDIGDPRSLGISDPSNRKIYFTRLTDISLDGLTLEVRMRVATTPPLDNQISGDPWPAEGIGYHIRDDGKGMIGVSDGVGIISFSLGKAGEADYPDAASDLLVMNNLVGAEPSGDVDTGEAATAVNMLAIEDAAQWNTFVIDIVAGGAGTHVVTVSANGGPAESFDVTVGNGTETGGPYIVIGSSGTGGITAFDVDYLEVSN